MPVKLSRIKPLEGIKPLRPMAVDGLLGKQQGGLSVKPYERTDYLIQPQGGETEPVQAASPADAVANWAKTQASDIWGIFKGLPELASTAANGALEIPGAVKEIYRGFTSDPNLAWDATKGVLSDVWRGATAHYRDEKGDLSVASAGRGVRDHTALALLDVLSLASLGAGAAGKGAMLAKSVGAVGAEAKLAKAAGVLRKIESAPYRALAKGLGRLEATRPVLALEEAISADPISRAAWSRKYEIQTGLAKEAADNISLSATRGLDPLERQYVTDVMNFRIAPDSATASPRAISAIKSIAAGNKWWGKRLGELQAKFASGGVGEASLRQAQIKKVALDDRMDRLGVKGLAKAKPTQWEAELRSTPAGQGVIKAMEAPLTPDELAAAERRRDAMVVLGKANGFDMADDFFQPWLEEATFDANALLDNVAESLGAPADLSSKRRMAFMERAAARPLVETDPEVWVSRATAARTAFLAEIQWQQEMISTYGKLIGPLDNVPPGYTEIPAMLYQKYMGEAAANLQVAVREYAATRDLQSAVITAAEEMLDTFSLAQKEMVEAAMQQKVVLPKGLARGIELEMQRVGGLGAMYDRGLGLWKNLIFLTPGFFVHNVVGNTLLTLLHGINPMGMGGRGFRNIPASVSQFGIYAAEKGGPLGERWGRLWRRLRGEHQKAMAYQDVPFRSAVFNRELMEAAKERQFADAVVGLVGEERIAQLTADLGDVERAVAQASLDLAEEARLAGREAGGAANLGELVKEGEAGVWDSAIKARQSLDKAVAQHKRVRELEPVTRRIDEAVAKMEQFFGAWGRSTPWAKRYMRRAVPFWSFARAMFTLAFKLPLIRPGTTMLWHRFTQMAQEYFQEEGVPPALRNAVMVGGTPDGRLVFARLTGFNPFDSAQVRRFGRVPIPRLFDPTASPLVSVAVKSVGGYDVFDTPQPLGVDQFMDTWGRAWSFDAATGEFVRASPQNPLWDTLGELVPQVSWLNDVLSPAGVQVPGRGPKLYAGPDGKPVNPRHWYWAIGRVLGTPIDSMEASRAESYERMMRYRMMKMVIKKAMAVQDPDQRRQILKVARDIIDTEAKGGR